MPYLEPSTQSLPFAADPDDRDGNTSREGARAIASDARGLRERYVRLLYRLGARGATDQEAADAMGIARTTLIPRRHELKTCVKDTKRKRVHLVRAGKPVRNKVWALAVFVDSVEPIDARRLA